jgi:Domain of unknown function (DUF4381)
MNDTSLERLHDVVLPAAVPWWPPAPGWYVVLALLLALAGWLAWRIWRSRRANAYRRAALRELAGLHEAPAIAELLRRTALAGAARRSVAAHTGTGWTDWLDAHDTDSMSAEVRRLLVDGVYGRRPVTDREVGLLRAYAAGWIVRHRRASLDAPDESESIELPPRRLTLRRR